MNRSSVLEPLALLAARLTPPVVLGGVVPARGWPLPSCQEHHSYEG